MIPFDALRAEAIRRDASHEHHTASARILSEHYVLLGLVGEAAFAHAFGLGDDFMRPEPGGDGGYDFVWQGRTVDIKSAQKAYYLLREVSPRNPPPDILVLAKVDLVNRRAALLGWEWDAEMRQRPAKEFGHGILNHYKPASMLRPMQELRALPPKTEDRPIGDNLPDEAVYPEYWEKRWQAAPPFV